MSQEILPAKARRCYACIQWEGVRTYKREEGIIKVDQTKEAFCLLLREKKPGRGTCDKFTQLL